MSVHPSSNSNHPTTLVSKDDRFRFILYFFAATALASALSIYPALILKELLASVYPFNPAQPDLPNPLGLIDILSGKSASPLESTSPFTQRWLDRFSLLSAVIFQIVFGAFTGIFQWIVLRQYLPKGNWILATILGYQLAGLLTFDRSNPAIYYSFVCQGLFQWLVLRQVVRDSWVWLLTHPLAFFLLEALGALLNRDFSGINYPSWTIYTVLLASLQTIIFCIFYPKSSQLSATSE